MILSSTPREQPMTSAMLPVLLLSLQTILYEQFSIKCAYSFILTTEVHVMQQSNVDQQ